MQQLLIGIMKRLWPLHQVMRKLPAVSLTTILGRVPENPIPDPSVENTNRYIWYLNRLDKIWPGSVTLFIFWVVVCEIISALYRMNICSLNSLKPLNDSVVVSLPQYRMDTSINMTIPMLRHKNLLIDMVVIYCWRLIPIRPFLMVIVQYPIFLYLNSHLRQVSAQLSV